MSDALQVVRERYTVRKLGMLVVIVAAVGWLFGPEMLGPIAVALVLGEIIGFARDYPGIDSRKLRLVHGAVVTLGSAALLAASLGAFGRPVGNQFAAPLFGVLTVLGGWWTLDAYTAIRYDVPRREGSDDIDRSEAMLELQVGHLVVESLSDGPKTVEELAADCDMAVSRVEDTLDRAQRAGVVVQRGETYERVERNIGPVGWIRSNGSRLLARLARPFRLVVG